MSCFTKKHNIDERPIKRCDDTTVILPYNEEFGVIWLGLILPSCVLKQSIVLFLVFGKMHILVLVAMVCAYIWSVTTKIVVCLYSDYFWNFIVNCKYYCTFCLSSENNMVTVWKNKDFYFKILFLYDKCICKSV